MGVANSTGEGIMMNYKTIMTTIEGFIECQEFNYMYYILTLKLKLEL